MLEINDANGPEVLRKDRNYLLMFYTDWCPRCPPLAEALDALQEKRSAEFEFAKIKFDENPAAVEFFNAIGVPFVFAVKEKTVLAGWGGLINEEAYEKIVDLAFCPPDKKLSPGEIHSLAAIGKEYAPHITRGEQKRE